MPIAATLLKSLRERWHMTQAQLAQAIGVERSAISQWETAERSIPMIHLERIADFFGVETIVFLEEDETLGQIEVATAFRADRLTPEDAMGISAFNRIAKNYIKMHRLLRSAQDSPADEKGLR